MESLQDGDQEWWAIVSSLALGAVYVILLGLNGYAIEHVVGSRMISPRLLVESPAIVMLAIMATRVIAFAALIVQFVDRRALALRSSIVPLWNRTNAWYFLAGAVASFVLNEIGLWPFVWRWQEEANVGFVQTLAAGTHWLWLAAWLLLYGVAVPLIEEVVFRFGVLQFLQRIFRSDRVAALGSAALFSAIHLGSRPWQPDLGHAWNATGVAVLGWILARMTIKRHGRIDAAIAVHCAVNLVAELSLVIHATYS